MSIVASVKVYDGIVLGAESMTQIYASTPEHGQQLVKAYENARKLFQLAKLPVGVLTFGAGNIGNRSVESFLGEFSEDCAEQIKTTDSIETVARHLCGFMSKPYEEAYSQIPVQDRPGMGFCICGYFDGPHHLGSNWELQFPLMPEPQLMLPDHLLGANWRGVHVPFTRLFYGFDPRIDAIMSKEGVSLDVINRVRSTAMQTLATQTTFDGMPVQDAIGFCKFIIETTIGCARYEIGQASCGGPLHLAVITKSGGFQWLKQPTYTA